MEAEPQWWSGGARVVICAGPCAIEDYLKLVVLCVTIGSVIAGAIITFYIRAIEARREATIKTLNENNDALNKQNELLRQDMRDREGRHAEEKGHWEAERDRWREDRTTFEGQIRAADRELARMDERIAGLQKLITQQAPFDQLVARYESIEESQKKSLELLTEIVRRLPVAA